MALLAAVFCCLHAAAGLAAPTYTLTQNTQLNFGTMQVPGSAVTDIISTSGGQSGTGVFLYGTVSAGDYTIKCTGSPCSAFTASITTSTPNCTGLSSVGSWNGDYNNGATTGNLPLAGLANPGAAGMHLKLGAQALFTNGVSAGSCTPTFTIHLAQGPFSFDFPQSASIAFDVPITFNKISDIDFGTVTALNSSTYRMSTAGAESVVAGTGAALYGTPKAANITIIGSTTDGITIQANGYTANNGVTPSNAQCAYNGGGPTVCTSAITGVAPGAGKTLLVGVDVATNGTQAAGSSAAPTFTINVNYQ